MVTEIAHVKVKDYVTLRALFDERRPIREEYGQIRERVLQSVDDPKQVTVILEWESLENAQAYTESPELKEAQQRAGFVEPPTVYFLKDAD